MCLLIAYSRLVPGAPLVLAANRDEILARPALPIDCLSQSPAILGGRDLAAGGTWMAVSAAGVVAALTNRPPREPGQRRTDLRSRGEFPLRLARHDTAQAAAEAFAREIDPALYNPCWLLVGDRTSLFYLEVAAGTPLSARALPPGIHVLENRPLDLPSPKVDRVRSLLPAPRAGGGFLRALEGVLGDRTIPARALAAPQAWPPPEVEAASVRAGPYGTRWSGLVSVPASKLPPRFLFSDGPAGEAAFQRARWQREAYGAATLSK